MSRLGSNYESKVEKDDFRGRLTLVLALLLIPCYLSSLETSQEMRHFKLNNKNNLNKLPTIHKQPINT